MNAFRPHVVLIVVFLQVTTQVVDMRSSVSKEACRTVAIMAHCLGSVFTPLAEQVWPSLMRIVAMKIQVMSSAADRCVRCLVALCVDHRLMLQIIESCGAKSKDSRKCALDYLCLASALWRYDVIEK